MAMQETVMTADAFWERYAGQPYELINGRVIEMPPTGFLHGTVTSRAATQLRLFVDEHELGEVVGAETGFWLSNITLKGADAAFISSAKLERITEPDKYLPFAPDLAVEVVSPSDSAGDIQQKVLLYLQAGTLLVWVMYPAQRIVVAHYPDNTSKTFTETDTLDDGDVLPGLRLPVTMLFPPKTDLS